MICIFQDFYLANEIKPIIKRIFAYNHITVFAIKKLKKTTEKMRNHKRIGTKSLIKFKKISQFWTRGHTRIKRQESQIFLDTLFTPKVNIISLFTEPLF